MKSQSTQQPNTFEAVGNGNYYYRWNVTTEQIEEQTMYNYQEVQVPTPIASNSVLSVVINELYGGGIEEKLINDYNAYKAGILTDQKYEDNYLAYLSARKSLKEQIENDVNTYYN